MKAVTNSSAGERAVKRGGWKTVTMRGRTGLAAARVERFPGVMAVVEPTRQPGARAADLEPELDARECGHGVSMGRTESRDRTPRRWRRGHWRRWGGRASAGGIRRAAAAVDNLEEARSPASAHGGDEIGAGAGQYGTTRVSTAAQRWLLARREHSARAENGPCERGEPSQIARVCSDRGAGVHSRTRRRGRELRIERPTRRLGHEVVALARRGVGVEVTPRRDHDGGVDRLRRGRRRSSRFVVVLPCVPATAMRLEAAQLREHSRAGSPDLAMARDHDFHVVGPTADEYQRHCALRGGRRRGPCRPSSQALEQLDRPSAAGPSRGPCSRGSEDIGEPACEPPMPTK